MSGTPGEVSLSNVWASELITPSREIVSATGRKTGKNLLFGVGSRILATNSRVAASHCSLGWIQLVLSLASFNALVM